MADGVRIGRMQRGKRRKEDSSYNNIPISNLIVEW